MQDWNTEYRRSIENPDAFWGDYARRFNWSKEWTQVSEWDGIYHRWFTGGRTNITVNALDRHADSDRRNRVASLAALPPVTPYIWLAEDGRERMVTYGQLYRMVCRFANGLKSIGVAKGDRVIIYVPLTIEGVVVSLIEHVRRELGPIAAPAQVEFVASLPKTRSGKIMRRYLKAKKTGVDRAICLRLKSNDEASKTFVATCGSGNRADWI